MSVPITSDDNAKFKLENERSYNSLSTAAFFMNMEIQEVVFVITHSWQMIINSDRVVYNQSTEFSVPEDKLSKGTSQGEWSCGWNIHTHFGYLSHATLIRCFLLNFTMSYPHKCSRNSILSKCLSHSVKALSS